MNRNKALCFLYDHKYTKQGNIALKSAKENNPEYTTILLTDNKTKSIADISLSPYDIGLDDSTSNWLIVGRVAMLEYVLTKLNFTSCIFIDGDTYTYNSYCEFQNELDKGHSIVVIPHITKPLPEDGLYPQTRTMCLAGNYNSGFVGATTQGLGFLRWWKTQTALYPQAAPEIGLASEQGWLRFAGDFDDHIKIFRHPGYNVAYWNIKERLVNYKDNQFYIDNKNLVTIHFSGLKKEIPPERLSVFQNRYILDKKDIVYGIYKSYHDEVWGGSE